MTYLLKSYKYFCNKNVNEIVNIHNAIGVGVQILSQRFYIINLVSNIMSTGLLADD